MGISSRDYIREERPGGFGGMYGGQWAIKYLIVANVLVFLAQNFDPRVTEWLALNLGWKQITQTANEPAQFFERQELEGALPREISVPLDAARADDEIPPQSSVEILGQYGEFAAIRWGDQYGLVPAAALQLDAVQLRIDPGRSWQVVWRVLTYGFCHGSFTHILFNMFVLWMFGRAVEPILGSREFLVFFLTGIVISGLGHIAFSLAQSSPAGAVGASGGVMAVVFLTAMTYPRMKVLVMFVIPAELWVLAIVYAVVDVMGMFHPGSGVAHAAHLGGAAFGVAYKHFNWRLTPLRHTLFGWASGWMRPRRRPKVRIYQPSDEPFSDRVDRILEKIHQQGEASLTDEERETLKEASRRLKGD